MERMLAGVATRRHVRTAEPVGAQVDREAKSTSRSAISRRFVRQTKTALAELMARDLAGEEIKVLMLDGEHLAERCVVVALAITADGTKKPIGLWDGSTENKTVVRALLADLVDRGLRSTTGCWWSSTAPRRCRRRCARCSAIRHSSIDVLCTSGATSPTSYPVRTRRGWMPSWSRPSVIPIPSRGCATPNTLPGNWIRATPVRPRRCARRAAGDVHRHPARHRRPDLAKTLTTSNPVESMISIARATDRNVTRLARRTRPRRAGQRPACSTPNDPSAASRATSRCRSSSGLCTDTPTPKPPNKPTLSVPPPRVRRGSSPKIHADRDMLSRRVRSVWQVVPPRSPRVADRQPKP